MILSSITHSSFALSLSQHQGLFQRVSFLHPVVKVLEISFSISPSNEYSQLISFSIDWFDLLAARGTLKSLLQHCSAEGVACTVKQAHVYVHLISALHSMS